MSAGFGGRAGFRATSAQLLAEIDEAFDARAAARERVRGAKTELAAARFAFTDAIRRARVEVVPYFVIARHLAHRFGLCEPCDVDCQRKLAAALRKLVSRQTRRSIQ